MVNTEKRKNAIIKMFIVIFVVIFIVCLYVIIKNFKEYAELSNLSEELIEETITYDTNSSIIDWDKLKNVNEDIIGWIQIDNTNINYPILKDNNLFYLKHSYDKKYNNNGSIFTIDRNPFNDSKTIIHGHNMKNGIMFSELSHYMNEEFYYSHNTFKIYTPMNNYEATIFSCYSIGVTTEKNNIELLDFNEEIEYYKNMSKYSTNISKKIEKIVKLSTCSYLNSTTNPTNQRYYIVANLEKIN